MSTTATRNQTRHIKRRKKPKKEKTLGLNVFGKEKPSFTSFLKLQEQHDYFHPVPSAAEDLYLRVAKESEAHSFNSSVGGKLPCRSPYLEGVKMGRGSAFTPKFKQYQETGGVARWKSSVVMNIRLNDLRDIHSANGNGTFKCNFFLDVAFWVPWWDSEHFDTQATVGTFSRFEPLFEFPGVDVEGGMLRWGLRSAEFSKHKDSSRQHEGQLGQNYTTELKGAKGQAKKVVSVVDPRSHWPRLWRVSITDEELKAMAKLDKKERKNMEPSNEDPCPPGLQPRLRALFADLDRAREKNLVFPTEGIGFVTYEIDCTHRNEFSLHEFPFDMHNLRIVVRLGGKDGDPLSRTIIPPSHDKAFFVSARVAKIVDYHLARNMDWDVTMEPAALGGNQRLNASVIVRRKPGYYVRNHIVVVFLISTSSFSSFLSMPNKIDSRAAIIFTVLLSIVAFKYTGSEVIPQVSYSNILAAYVLLNFYVVLALAAVNLAFSTQCTMGGTMNQEDAVRVMKDLGCSRNPGKQYGLDFIPPYDPVVEASVGVFLFLVWCVGNVVYWRRIWGRVRFNLGVVDKAMIGWMTYKYKGPKGTKGQFLSEKFIAFKSPQSSSKEVGWCGRLWEQICRSGAQQNPSVALPSHISKIPAKSGIALTTTPKSDEEKGDPKGGNL